MAAPLNASTATTCAPKIPVTPGGEMSNDNGFAAKILPVIVPVCTMSFGSGYRARSPVRSSSANGASGCCAVGRGPAYVPGAGAKGNMMALQTAE